MPWIPEIPSWQVGLLGTYAGLVAILAFRHILLSYEMRRTPFLTRRSPAFEAANAPLVSILVPAKDEAEGIADCLASLCAQDYPNFEILVVDDRSQDDTAKIVAQWAKRDRRIRLMRIFELPPQWTGKTHALHQCQKSDRGEWLFFVDADTRMQPSCLSIVLRDCIESGADMESLLPAMDSDSFWVRILQPLASILLLQLYRPSRVNDPASANSGMANGQFILIRRNAYRAIGGHEAVKGEFCEDIHLGRRARKHGLALRIVGAPDLASVKMYSTVKGFVSGWSRIFYSAVDTRVAPLWGLAALLCLFSLLPYAVMLASGGTLFIAPASLFARAAFGLALAHEFCQWTFYGRLFARSATKLRYLPFRIVSVLGMLHVLRKTIRLCHTHEVNWRGTNYTVQLRQPECQRRAA
jgi:chlorobactene glucosyltransferase